MLAFFFLAWKVNILLNMWDFIFVFLFENYEQVIMKQSACIAEFENANIVSSTLSLSALF